MKAAPETPDADEAGDEAALAADLRLVVGRLARRLRRADDGGMTASQVSALSSVEALEPVRLGDLAAAERVTSPTLTKIVGNLEAAGLIQRSADPADGRATRITLTAAGRDRLMRLRTERNAFLQQRMAALGPHERDALRAALPVLSSIAGQGPA